MFGWLKKRREKKKLISGMNYVSQHVAPFYNNFTIKKKSGGLRTISAPVPEVKELQNTILRRYFYGISPSRYSHGFIKRRSVKSAATPHLNKNILVVIDIKDFFPSITRDRIFPLLKSIHDDFKDESFTNLVLDILTDNDKLPQGSPASPTISNLIFKEIDEQLYFVARRYKAVYTRYADDLFFSSNSNQNLPGIIKEVEKILAIAGFSINRKKFRVTRKHQKQIVAGVQVNAGKLSVGRKKIRILRAQIHKIEERAKNGTISLDDPLLNSVKGKLAWYGFINPDSVKQYQKTIDSIESNLPRS